MVLLVSFLTLEGVGQAVAPIAAVRVPELLFLLVGRAPGRTLVLSSTSTWKLDRFITNGSSKRRGERLGSLAHGLASLASLRARAWARGRGVNVPGRVLRETRDPRDRSRL